MRAANITVIPAAVSARVRVRGVVGRGAMDAFVLFVCLSLVAAQPGAPPVIKEHPSNVVARRNDPATLNCAALGSSRIRWFRDGEEVVTSSQDQRSHRVLLSSGSLFFLRVTATRRDSDAGTYWCVASNSYGATRSKNATLIVATLAHDFQQQADSSTKVLVGESITLPCRPPKGTPPPEVTWLRDGHQVTNSSRISVNQDGDLIIARAVQQDSAKYICRARNAAGARQAPPSHLTVMTPPWFEEQPSNTSVASGAGVELGCRARGFPTPTVTWRQVDGGMSLGGATIEDQRLVLQKVTVADSGVYECEAKSEAGVATARATLTVLDAPVLTQRPQHLQVIQGNEAQLRCLVEGEPEPLVLWRLPSADRTAVLSPGHSSSHASVSDDGSTLLLHQPSTEDTGVYYCWGINSGGGVSGRAEVVVVTALPPPVVGVGPKDLTVAPGGVVRFSCEVVSEAAPASVTWWYQPSAHLPSRQLSQHPHQPRFSLPENGALIIKDVWLDDAGIYSCHVTATTGSIQQEAVLNVVEDTEPKESPLLPPPPTKPRILGWNQTSVHLSWLPNSQGSKAGLHWYAVEYWRQGWSEWRVADAVITQESCVVSRLSLGHTYTFLVRAVNSQGASFPSPWSDPVSTRANPHPTLTAEQVRQVQRRLARPLVTLTKAMATAADSVILNWSFLEPVEDWVDGVLVYWMAEGGRVEVATVLGTSSTNHLHNLHPNTPYTFFIVPFLHSVEGTPSNSYHFTTPEDVPLTEPGNVRITRHKEGSMLIEWSGVSTEEAQGEVIGYKVTLSHNGSQVTETVGTPYLETRDLLPGHIYTVRVAALTSAGTGPFSAPVVVEGQGLRRTVAAGEVLYAPPQAVWLAYLLIPLVLLLVLGVVWYLWRVRHKAPPASPPYAPPLYQDPSINMYSDHKVWRPSDSDKDSSLSSSRLLKSDQLVSEYAEPRLLLPNHTTEPYATTALLAPSPPHTSCCHPNDQSAEMQVNWAAILPPPPDSPPPDLDLGEPRQQGVAPGMCSRASQYDNVGKVDPYRRPCDADSEHTYEPYAQVIPSDRFHTFSSLQRCGDNKLCVDCHLAHPGQPPRGTTH